MKDNRKQFARYLLIDVLVVTIVFLALYHPFIFGDKLYAYEDIGCDTVHQYLPVTHYELGLLESGEAGGYRMDLGFGGYVSGLWVKYLNPANLPLLLFGQAGLQAGILAATYGKYVLICLFALLFFDRLVSHRGAASLCALLWTFSGYNVLWGQHYQFLTAMVAFTACMYGFQLFLQRDSKQWLAVFTTAYLAVVSYYHLYIACFFLLVYGVVYMAFRGEGIFAILKRAGLFLLAMVPALCMAGVYLVPAVTGFLDSARSAGASSVFVGGELLYRPNVIMAFGARLLSNDLIGTGNGFRGPTNYDECAILSVSLLFVYSVVYLALGRRRGRVLGLTAAGAVLLCMPFTSRLLIFIDHAQRWTYVLCFAQVITIGFALSHYLRHRGEEKKRALRTLLIGDGVLAAAAAALVAYHFHAGSWLNAKACLSLLLTALCFHVAFWLLWKGKGAYRVLLVLVAAELVLVNYATVNDRLAVNRDKWEHAMYNDGTAAVVQWLQERDSSLFRINKTYDSVCSNDMYMQGGNGVGIYSSTNPEALIRLARSLGYEEAGHWISLDGDDVLANSLLGVKYVIARADAPLDAQGYRQIYSDGTFLAYEAEDWNGFGYLYREGAGLYMPEAETGDRVDIRVTEDGFAGDVTNGGGEEALACIPLVYSRFWRAELDGVSVEVLPVNEGLTGIYVPAGTHRVHIRYDDSLYRAGGTVSAVTLCLYTAAVVIYCAVRKRKQKTAAV